MGAWIFDFLVILGSVVMSLGVFGMIRMPDIYTKIHAASKAVVLGVSVLAIAGMVHADLPVVMRLLLLVAVLLLATPVSSAAVGRAGFLEHERMRTPGAIDESGSHLANGDDSDTAGADHAREPAWRL